MKRFLISLPEELDKKIKNTVQHWGFTSKADFFRYLAINFIRTDEQFRQTIKNTEPRKKEISKIQAKKRLTERTKTWKKENRYLPAE